MKSNVKSFLEAAEFIPGIPKLKYEIAYQFSQAQILSARMPDVLVEWVTQDLAKKLVLGVIERTPSLDLEDETLP